MGPKAKPVRKSSSRREKKEKEPEPEEESRPATPSEGAPEPEEPSVEDPTVQDRFEESESEREETSRVASEVKQDPSFSSKSNLKEQRKGSDAAEKTKSKEEVEPKKEEEREKEKEKEKQKQYCQEPLGATVYQIEARYLVYHNLKLCGGVRVILNCLKEEGFIQLISLTNEVISSFDIRTICFLESNSAAGASWCGYPIVASSQNKGEEERDVQGEDQGEEDASEEFKRHQRERSLAEKKCLKVEFAQVIFCTPDQMQRFRTVVETVKCALDCSDFVPIPDVPLESHYPYEGTAPNFLGVGYQQETCQGGMPCQQQSMYPPVVPSSSYSPSFGYAGPQQYPQGASQQQPQPEAISPGRMPMGSMMGQPQQFYGASQSQGFPGPSTSNPPMGNEYPGAYGNMQSQMFGPNSPPRPPGGQPDEQFHMNPNMCLFQKGTQRQTVQNRPNCIWQPIKDPCPTSCLDNDTAGPIPFDPCPLGPMVANLPPCLPCDMGDPYSFSKTESRVIFCTPACLKISRNDNDPCPMICRGKLKILECAAGLGFSLRLESAEGLLLFGHSLRRNLVLGPTDEAEYGFSYVTVVCRARKTSLEHVVLSFPSEYQMEQFANAVEDCKRILSMTSARNLTRNVL